MLSTLEALPLLRYDQVPAAAPIRPNTAKFSLDKTLISADYFSAKNKNKIFVINFPLKLL